MADFKSNFFEPISLKPDFRILIISPVGVGGAIDLRDFLPNIELTKEFKDPDRGFVTGTALAS